MELRHLRYFVIVAEEQNVTRAAERLHVSQPPLSRQIRDLEGEIGVQLFKRTAKSLALTEAGKIFLVEARAVLLRAEEAVQAARTVAAGGRGQLRIGYAPSLSVEILPLALREFEKTNPGVRVTLHDLSSEECVQRLGAKKIDLALTVPPGGPSMRGLRFEKLKTYALCCAVAMTHPLARKRSLRLGQLRKERFIALSQEDYPEYPGMLRTIFAPAGFEPLVGQDSDSATGLIAAVEAGQGVAIVPAAYQCMTGPRVKLVPFVPSPPPVVLGALTGKEPVAWGEKFIAAVRKVVGR